MGTSETDDAVKLAAIEQQLSHLTKTTDEIKDALKNIQGLDRQLAQIRTEYDGSRKEIQTMWVRLDEFRKAMEAQEREMLVTQRAIESSIHSTQASFEAVVNKGRGAWWILAGVLSVCQVVGIGVATWAFNGLTETSKTNAVQQYRIEQLETRLKLTESK